MYREYLPHEREYTGDFPLFCPIRRYLLLGDKNSIPHHVADSHAAAFSTGSLSLQYTALPHLPEFTPQELNRIKCILGRLDFTLINEENYNAGEDFQEHIQMITKDNTVLDKIQIYQLNLLDEMIGGKIEKIRMN